MNTQLQQSLVQFLERIDVLLGEIAPIAENCDRLRAQRTAIQAKITEERATVAKINEMSNNGTKLVETIYQLFKSMKKTIDELKSKSNRRINFISANGTFIDKLNVSLLIDNGQTIRSEPILTSVSGYAMELIYELETDGHKQKSYLTVSLVLLKGNFDPILTWPIMYPITISILDPSPTKNHIQHSVSIPERPAFFNRPVNGSNKPYKIQRLCSVDKLDDKGSSYIQDGLLFVQLQIDFTPPSRTSSPEMQTVKRIGNLISADIAENKA